MKKFGSMPPIKPLKGINFTTWKVLPLVYDEALSYYEIQSKLVYTMNHIIKDWNGLPAYIQKLIDRLVIDTTGDTGGIMGFSWGHEGFGIDGRNQQSMYVFKLPTGKNLLVDTGWPSHDPNVGRFFAAIDVDKLDYIVITHYHSDHAGNLENIAKVVDCENATIFLPPQIDNTVMTSPADVQAVTNEGVIESLITPNHMTVIRPDSEGYEYEADAATTFRFYNVNHTAYYAAEPFDYNNCCLCMELSYRNTSYWISSDIAKLAQEHLAGYAPKVTAADMAHHGSNAFINQDYWNRLSPTTELAENGAGTSNGGFVNYIDRYSGENLVAQRHGVYVYPTSKGMTIAEDVSYVVPFWIDSKNVWFMTPALDTDRVGKHNFAIGDATFEDSTVNTGLDIAELVDTIDKNSRSTFVVPTNYDASPGTTLGYNAILDIIKSNSASSLLSMAGIDQQNDLIYRAAAWIMNGIGYDVILGMFSSDAEGNVTMDAQNMSGRNFFQKTVDVNTETDHRYTFNNTFTRFFGDNAEISSGDIVIKKSGLYKISVSYVGSEAGDGETPYSFKFARERAIDEDVAETEYSVSLSGVSPNGIYANGYAENVVWLSEKREDRGNAPDHLFLTSTCPLTGSIRVRLELLSYSTDKKSFEVLTRHIE